jgi:hypothetical protein
MEVPDLFDRLRANQRHVTRKHQDMLKAAQSFSRLHHGMARSTLLKLLHELDSRGLQRFADTFRFMADDGEDVLRRNDLGRGGYHVSQ